MTTDYVANLNFVDLSLYLATIKSLILTTQQTAMHLENTYSAGNNLSESIFLVHLMMEDLEVKLNEELKMKFSEAD